jgi:epoxyqueuosine reductase
LNKTLLANKIRQKAIDEGFLLVGFSKSQRLELESFRLESWLKSQKNGTMEYMENHFDMRVNPELLLPGTKSIISFAYNYFPEKKQNEDTYKISKYAYGEDYHKVVKNKLFGIVEYIKELVSIDISYKVCVDSAPILEKTWAQKSGLGWLGKNTNIIHPKSGSFFFLGEILLDLELEEDVSIKDFCGTCNKCIESCPTEAIVKPYEVDGSKCISYFTIELKKELSISNEMKGKFNDWIFGCDICQDVCPWNRFSKPHQEKKFEISDELKAMTKNDWQELTEEGFKILFKNSPIKRPKFEGLKRNIEFISSTYQKPQE